MGCALENGADLYVNEGIALGLLKKEEEEEERRMTNLDFFLLLAGAYLKLRYMAMLYTHSIGNQL